MSISEVVILVAGFVWVVLCIDELRAWFSNAREGESKQAKGQFVVTINLNDVGTYSTFPEAFRHFYRAVKAGIKDKTIPTWRLLETACFISERRVDKGLRGYWGGYWGLEEAKEAAFALGLFTENGKLTEVAGGG